MAGSNIIFQNMTELVTIHVRHHNITDNDIRKREKGFFKSLFPVFSFHNMILILEIIFDIFAYILIIFY